MRLSSRLLLLTAHRTVRRAERERRRQLERELSAYSSPVDLADFGAMLDRYPDGHVHELRSILGQQQQRRTEQRRPVAGLGSPLMPPG